LYAIRVSEHIDIEIPKNNIVTIINLKIQKLILKFIQVLNVWRLYTPSRRLDTDSNLISAIRNLGLANNFRTLEKRSPKVITKIEGYTSIISAHSVPL